MPIHQVKEQPAASTYAQKKGCPTCDTNCGTPCTICVIFYIMWNIPHGSEYSAYRQNILYNVEYSVLFGFDGIFSIIF